MLQMNRIEALFTRKKKNILNIYFTAGFPELDAAVSVVTYLDQAGADIVELGIPYSDPLADGPTIQESGTLALKNGMTIDLLFQQVKKIRSQSEIPIVLMGYFNQMLQYGVEDFLDQAASNGADALIMPDLPMDVYKSDYQSMFEERSLGISFLVTPQTSDERIKRAAELSKNSFLYIISKSSITGSASNISQVQIDYFNKLEKLKADTPSLIGFGIHNKETFLTASAHANGAIIGSAFIRHLSKYGFEQDSISSFIDGILK